MISFKAIEDKQHDSMPADLVMGGEEKRKYTRTRYSVPIEISYLGKGIRLSGQTLNHCEDGMCFEVMSSFQTGQAINIRVKDFDPKGQCVSLCQGLRTITLAEVKWCHEIPVMLFLLLCF